MVATTVANIVTPEVATIVDYSSKVTMAAPMVATVRATIAASTVAIAATSLPATIVFSRIYSCNCSCCIFNYGCTSSFNCSGNYGCNYRKNDGSAHSRNNNNNYTCSYSTTLQRMVRETSNHGCNPLVTTVDNLVENMVVTVAATTRTTIAASTAAIAATSSPAAIIVSGIASCNFSRFYNL